MEWLLFKSRQTILLLFSTLIHSPLVLLLDMSMVFIFVSSIGIFFACLIYKILSRLIRDQLLDTLTPLNDFHFLAKQRDANKRIPGTAVIAGGSASGLLSARVCADHFEEVLIVEADTWVTTEDGGNINHREKLSGNIYVNQRPKIRQWPSLHVYQIPVLKTLERLFPNFKERLEKIGGRYTSSEDQLYISGHYVRTPYHLFPNGQLPHSFKVARSVLEAGIRKWTLGYYPNVKQISGVVIGVIPTDDFSSNLTGVRIKSGDSHEINIPAALVIDCTGVSHGGYRWLSDLPTARSDFKEEIKKSKRSYEVNNSYSNFEFHLSAAVVNRLQSLEIPGICLDPTSGGSVYAGIPPPGKDTGAIFVERVDRNILVFNPATLGKNVKLNSLEELRNFLRSLDYDGPIPPWLYEVIDIMEEEQVPCKLYHTRTSSCTSIEYHKVKSLPSNFVAVGDAVCHLNAIRGQGFCKLVTDVITLNAALERTADSLTLPSDFSRRYFEVLNVRTGSWWNLGRDVDYGLETVTPTKGDDPKKVGRLNRLWSRQIMTLCVLDPEVSAVDFFIRHGLAPATDMFCPKVIRKILWMNVKKVFGFGTIPFGYI